MPACPAGHDSAADDFCDVCGMRIGGAAPASSPPASAASSSGQGAGLGDASAAAGSAAGAGSAGSAGAGSSGGQVPPSSAEWCPQCGTERSGQFCEVCGFDFASGRPAAVAASGHTAPLIAPAATAGPATTAADTAGPATAPADTVGPATTAAAPGPSGPAPPLQVMPESATGTAQASWTAVVTADRGYFDRVVAAGGPAASALEFPVYCPERRFRLARPEMRIGRRSVSRGLDPEIDLTGPPTDPGVSHLHAVLVARPDGGWSVLDPGSSNGTQVNGADIATGQPVPLRPGDRINIGAWTALTVNN